jgi:glycosyltransferase involved in cell wall biosynthesis
VAKRLVVNLSSLTMRPTGLSVYAESIVPFLAPLKPVVLIREERVIDWSVKCPAMEIVPIASNLSSDSGVKGHLRRLLWIEKTLPPIVKGYGPSILFSPVPEAPITRNIASIVMVPDFIPRRFFPRTSLGRAYNSLYGNKVLRKAMHVLTISECTAEDAWTFAGVDRSATSVIPLACDREHFKPLGLPRKNYFLFVGRCKEYKNVRTALQAFASLQRNDLEFWVAGPPDEDFNKLAEEFSGGEGGAVKFLPYPNYADLPALYNQAVALVFPSLWEGFGLPILEAMACGTPVITSNVSSMPEVAGTAALLVDPKSRSEIAEAMTRVADNGSLSTKLSEAGIARASEFSWAKAGQQTVDVLSRYL